MTFVTGAEMRALEEAAFRRGVDAESLMEAAGAGIARRLIALHPRPGRCVAFIGKGNNGGDAWVALRHLRAAGWRIEARTLAPELEWGALPRRKARELGPGSGPEVEGGGPLLVLDALLGIGAKGPLRPPLREGVAEIAGLRERHGAVVAAVDLPSGMDADSGEGEAVTADLTLTVGAPKRGLATEAGILRAGRIVLVPLDGLEPPAGGSPALFCPEFFPGLLAPRPHDFHKGRAGRLGILAGSPGMSGAAVLCAAAALRAGAGLVTLHVERDFLPSLAAAMPPEVMVRVADEPVLEACAAGHDAIVAGPGCGAVSARWRNSLLAALAGPGPRWVLDADALNLLAAAGRRDVLRPECLITPHPGEFRRLAPELADRERVAAAAGFVERHPCTLLLKGARTLVAAPGGAVRVNPTGHAGMASGGQGDVLAGVAGALLAQGVGTVDAGSLAAWLCGRAAERVAGPIASAGAVVEQLGGAMEDWRGRRR